MSVFTILVVRNFILFNSLWGYRYWSCYLLCQTIYRVLPVNMCVSLSCLTLEYVGVSNFFSPCLFMYVFLREISLRCLSVVIEHHNLYHHHQRESPTIDVFLIFHRSRDDSQLIKCRSRPTTHTQVKNSVRSKPTYYSY